MGHVTLRLDSTEAGGSTRITRGRPLALRDISMMCTHTQTV